MHEPMLFGEGAELSAIASTINAHHRDAINHAKHALEHARQAGEQLAKAKSLVAHGNWLGWLSANCSVSERQAQRYMRVAAKWDAISKYDAATSHLTVDGALAAVANEVKTKAKLENWTAAIQSIPRGRALYRDGENGYSVIFESGEHTGYYHLYSYLIRDETAEAQETRRPVRARGIAVMLDLQGDDLGQYVEDDNDGIIEQPYSFAPVLPASDTFHDTVYGELAVG